MPKRRTAQAAARKLKGQARASARGAGRRKKPVAPIAPRMVGTDRVWAAGATGITPMHARRSVGGANVAAGRRTKTMPRTAGRRADSINRLRGQYPTVAAPTPPAKQASALGRKGKEAASWVRRNPGKTALGGIAGVGIYGATQSSGRATSRTNYADSRGIYGY